MSDKTMDVPTADEAAPAEVLDDDLVQRLAERARTQGVSLTGEDGLLQQMTKLVLEAGPGGRDGRPSWLRQA